MKNYALIATFLMATAFFTNAHASLLRCETGDDAGVKASGTFYVTNRCPTGNALKNPRTGKLNCLSVIKDFSRFNAMNVDVCVVQSEGGLMIVDMRPQGAE